MLILVLLNQNLTCLVNSVGPESTSFTLHQVIWSIYNHLLACQINVFSRTRLSMPVELTLGQIPAYITRITCLRDLKLSFKALATVVFLY